jgi:hypothetical protein
MIRTGQGTHHRIITRAFYLRALAVLLWCNPRGQGNSGQQRKNTKEESHGLKKTVGFSSLLGLPYAWIPSW